MNYDEIWNALLENIKPNIPQRQFDLWFKDTKLIFLQGNLATIQMPNEMIRVKIEDNYVELIQNSLAIYTETKPILKFVVEKKKISSKESQGVFDFIKEEPKEETNTSSTKKNKKSDKKISIQPPALNELYTFENFVVGPSNSLAYAAALAVAKNPGRVYNPLFMYGSVGLGKTHLLQAICNEILSHGYNEPIIYLSCEDFINDFIHAIEQGKVNDFREKYRNTSILVIDDIHFLANKERTQDEFFHTFNTLYNLDKQIILSSDSSASEIPELKSRLVSRFRWGLETQLLVPSIETRIAIVKKKSKLKNQELADNICKYIAEHIESNIRELEGAVNHLLATAELAHRDITLDFCKKALRDIITYTEPQISLYKILEEVSHYFKIKMSDLLSQTRQQKIVLPRQIAMYLSKKLTQNSLQEIGTFFGRDHTTILHAIDKIEIIRKKNSAISSTLDDIECFILEKK